MASAASSEMLEAIDIEELEVTETDAALLRELLEESTENEVLEKDRVKQIVRAVENELKNADSNDDKPDRLEQTEELIIDGFQLCWPEMVEMTPDLPSADETMAWYMDYEFATDVFDCNIDYSQLYGGGVLFEEETTYGYLWQD